ncbi:dihydrodipicolinate synthase family protein [uncultured Veillonella sp.]|uniref:dihydrodipicolinate synthase family protein n=1 Tax=uncultured Veillonella sp. TaxID=159268 RepID=UPI0026384B75|nr:dihydrodipicolinate synthase family protein [uncultured Veillonella sp.]
MKQVKIITPIVTVFDDNQKLDVQGNTHMIEHLIANGVDGILALGSTGEFAYLTLEEKKAAIDLYCKVVNKRVTLFVGTGTMDAAETIELSNYAIQQGADGVCVVPPYYYGLSDNVIELYFDKIASEIKGNIWIYNYPDRTSNTLEPSVLLKLLAKHPNIVGYKDTVNNSQHTREIICAVRDLYPDFAVYSGFDSHFLDNVSIGGAGCIGALSNLYPEVWSGLVKAYNTKDFDKVNALYNKLLPLMEIYGYRRNFPPIMKRALNLLGHSINETCRFPEIEANEEETRKLKTLLGLQ